MEKGAALSHILMNRCLKWAIQIFLAFSYLLCKMEEVVGSFARRLAISDTEVEVVMPTDSSEEGTRRWFLVGELLTTKSFKMDLLVSTMRGLWIPKDAAPDRGRIEASRIGGHNRMLFTFRREADLKWAIKGSPWSFDKALLAVAITDGKEDPMEVSLCNQLFWVRVRGLPPAYLLDERVERTGRIIGQAIGIFVKAVRGSRASRLGDFLRIRVGMDVSVPLKRWVTFRPDGWAESKRFDLEYERLPHFCFFCGSLSHTGGRCPRKESGELTVPAYDALMNADKKEEWLLAQLHKDSQVLREGCSSGGRRFGLFPAKKPGWIMTAPELPTSGLIRSRAERDEGPVSRREREETDMEVDEGAQLGSVQENRDSKRRRTGTPENAACGSRAAVSPKVLLLESGGTLNSIYSQSEILGGIEELIEGEREVRGLKESPRRKSNSQKGMELPNLSLARELGSQLDVIGGEGVGLQRGTEKGNGLSQIDRVVLGLDLNKNFPTSPVKESKQKLKIKSDNKASQKKESKAGKGVCMSKKVVVNKLSPKKSPGRTQNRLSVMGPVSTHHEP